MANCELGFMVSSFAAPRPCHDGQIPLRRGAVPRGVRIGKYLAVSTLQSMPVSKRTQGPTCSAIMRLHSTLLYAISAELHRLFSHCGARTEVDYRAYKRVKQYRSDSVDTTASARQSFALSREGRPPTKHSRALFTKHNSQIIVEDGSTRAPCILGHTKILGSTLSLIQFESSGCTFRCQISS